MVGDHRDQEHHSDRGPQPAAVRQPERPADRAIVGRRHQHGAGGDLSLPEDERTQRHPDEVADDPKLTLQHQADIAEQKTHDGDAKVRTASADHAIGAGGRQETEATQSVHGAECRCPQVEFTDDGRGQQSVEDRDDHAALGIEQDEAAHPQPRARSRRGLRRPPGGRGSRRPVRATPQRSDAERRNYERPGVEHQQRHGAKRLDA